MESLYNKYRPTTFDEVVGQHHVVETIERAVREQRVSHAYLFCGPRGTGKTTMARLLAKALLCQQGRGELPDGTCEDCRLIAAGNHPDVLEIDAASNTGVDNVRDQIISRASYAPVRGDYKVYIIDEVHMLTPAAFNALLKTLEEPPEHVVFVMCTTDPQKILGTVLSRVQRFDFHAISNNDLQAYLVELCAQEEISYEPAALELIARSARGGMRDALKTLEQLALYTSKNVTLDAARDMLGETDARTLALVSQALAARDIPKLFSQVASLVEGGRDLLRFTNDLAAHLRDVYVAAVAGSGKDVLSAADDPAELAAEAAAFEDADRVARALGVLADAAGEMRHTTNQRLVLEVALTRIARPKSDLTLDALAERVAALERSVRALASHAGAAAAHRAGSAAEPASAPAAPVAPEPAAPAASAMPAAPAAPAAPSAPVPVPAPEPEPVATPAPSPAPAPEPAPIAPSEVGSNSADLQRRWRQTVEKVRASSAAKGSLLANAVLESDDGSSLSIAFPAGSRFAMQMLVREDVRSLLNAVITEVFGPRTFTCHESADVVPVPREVEPVAAPVPAPQPMPAPVPPPSPEPSYEEVPASAYGDAAEDRESPPWEDDAPAPNPAPAPEPAPEQPAATVRNEVDYATPSELANLAAMLEDAFGHGVNITMEDAGTDDIDAVESGDDDGFDDYDKYDGEGSASDEEDS